MKIMALAITLITSTCGINTNCKADLPRQSVTGLMIAANASQGSLELRWQVPFVPSTYQLEVTRADGSEDTIIPTDIENTTLIDDNFMLLVSVIVSSQPSISLFREWQNWLNSRLILEGCNDEECLDSNEVTVTVDLLVELIPYIKISNTGPGDNFGSSVSMNADGNTLAAGAPSEDSDATGIDGADNDLASNSGAVYVFTRLGAAWSQQAYIKASNTGSDDNFGSSVSMNADGNTLAVGATSEDSDATGIDGADNDLASNSGAVYVFTRSGSTWSQQAYIKASNTGSGDTFGVSVSLSGDGNTLAVGADRENSDATGIGGPDNDLASNSGAVYVFTRSGSAWSQQAYIKASNTGADDEFGVSVSLSNDGNTLAVGALHEDGNAIGIDGADNDLALDAGAVYVFTRSGSAWSQQAYIKTSNTGADDEFGVSVSLSNDGNTLVAGAPSEDSDATGIDGADNDLTLDAGAVYVFTRSGSAWSQQAYIKTSNTGADDEFGVSVSLSNDGNTLVAGAPSEDSDATGIDSADNDLALDAGAVYVFTRSGSTWLQEAYIKASNTGRSDVFGRSVSLNADGNSLIVGALFEDSDATGVGGADNDLALNSGAVYSY